MRTYYSGESCDDYEAKQFPEGKAPEGWVKSRAYLPGGHRYKSAPQPTPEPAEISPKQAADSLDGMKKAELVKIAEDNGIEIDKQWPKAKIAETIKKAMGQ